MTAYTVPVEGRSDEDDARLVHADLDGMSLDDLEHELCRVVVALAAVDRHDVDRWWLLARLRRVRAAIRKVNAENDNARRTRAGAVSRIQDDDRRYRSAS
ncbi:MAG: hypothetical protein KIT14_13760 [bacterium]|nr:hypothetical protein [bacterium]